jgi:N-acetyl-anhydromuramyl-L-alanine amidase AmpD
MAQLQARIEELIELPPLGPGLARPAIRDVVDSLPTHGTRRYPQRSLADINQIVIHHTGTSSAVTPQSIAKYQVQKAGKPGILYHFFIAADGTVYQCNRLETVSDHAHERSQASVGVCFAGSFTERIPSPAQLQSGGSLCAWLLSRLCLLPERIVGAGEFASTQSPGTQWLQGRRWKDKLLLKVKTVLDSGDTGQQQTIARLKAQVASLHRQLERYRREPPSKPAPTQVAISMPPIQDIIETLPKHETKRYGTRSREAIETLVIHHSAVAPAIGPPQIARYHTGTLDWPGIGYHFLIGADGTTYQGNHLETISHHAASVNPRGVGICFLGNFKTEIPPPAQLQSGARLAAWLLQELDLGLDEVKGHREFMHTACPGNQWLGGKAWKQALRQEIEKVR